MPPAQHGEIAEAIERLRRAQRAPDARVAGVLYWYALSGAMAGLALVEGRDVERGRVTVGPGGWPSVDGAPPSDDPLPALGRVFRSLPPTLAAASGASERALAAIGTDSIASAALAAPDPRRLARAALDEIGPGAPPARFEEVPGRGTVVRRGSCCLLYLCPGSAKCLSCPRQTPRERLRRLRA